MNFERELKAYWATTREAIATYHKAQTEAGMNGPLADAVIVAEGLFGGIMLHPIRRLIARHSPEMIIQQSESRIKDLFTP